MSENLEKVAAFAACGTTDPAPACGSVDPAPACGSADPAPVCGGADPKAAPSCGTACGAADAK